MRIDFDSSKISTNDYVIVANNRQILAFKDSWQNLNGVSELPKVNTWNGFIKELFELHNVSKEHQLINDNLITKCFQQILGLNISKNKKLIKEIVNNLIICENYLINIESSNYEIDSEFIRWHKEYQTLKSNLISWTFMTSRSYYYQILPSLIKILSSWGSIISTLSNSKFLIYLIIN